MSSADLESLDIATLALFASGSANQRLIAAARVSGHPALRNAHGYLIQHIIAESKPVGELAELLGVTQQAVSKTTLELESMGYVARELDPDDTRVRRIALTSRGRAAVERARAARAKLEAALVKAVGARNVNAARRTLIGLLELTGGAEAVAQRKVKPISS